MKYTLCTQRTVKYQPPFWYVSQSIPDGYDDQRNCSRFVIDSSHVIPGSTGRLYSCYEDKNTPAYSRFEGYPPGSSQKVNLIVFIRSFEPGPVPVIFYDRPDRCTKVNVLMKGTSMDHSMETHKLLSLAIPFIDRL